MTTSNNAYWSFSPAEQPPAEPDSHRIGVGSWLRILALALAACAILVVFRRPAPSDQHLAIEEIRNSGGSVTTADSRSSRTFAYGDTGTSGPIEAIEIFDPRIVEASLWNSGVLEFPEALLKLRAPLSDDDLRRLKLFRNLRVLDLRGAAISNESLMLLQPLGQLEELFISCERIDDSELHQLITLPRLRVLSLSSTQLTDTGLETICQLQTLCELRVARTQITDDGLRHVAQLEGLAHLNIANTAVTDAGLAHLHALTNLRWLNLDNVPVTDQGLIELEQQLPLCHLCRGNWLNDAGKSETLDPGFQTP